MEQTKINWGDMTPEQVVASLDTMHRSKAYLAIRDDISKDKVNEIAKSEQYQLFQDIKLEAKRSFDHDRTMASNADVDRACTTVYGILVKMIGTQGDAIVKELREVHHAINRIEEHIGLEPTKWSIDADGTENTNGEGSTDNS